MSRNIAAKITQAIDLFVRAEHMEANALTLRSDALTVLSSSADALTVLLQESARAARTPMRQPLPHPRAEPSSADFDGWDPKPTYTSPKGIHICVRGAEPSFRLRPSISYF